jgi:hypothetical protein
VKQPVLLGDPHVIDAGFAPAREACFVELPLLVAAKQLRMSFSENRFPLFRDML